MRGLALEGGGAKGSYEIGAYIALKELGYKFNMVAGTSIGSLNAALIVQGDIELAQKLWMSADSEIVGINKDIVKTYKNFDFSILFFILFLVSLYKAFILNLITTKYLSSLIIFSL